jgi:hypothetical protein
VPKGDDNVRMVYNGTVSGLNDSIWVPSFLLPTIETHLRAVDEGTHMADVDVGECFLNFILHPEIRELAGVDLTPYFGEDDNSLWEVWDRAAMGLQSSPYQAVSALTVADEIIQGDRFDEENIFQWVRVRLNLPGNLDYDPNLPWVSKVRADGRIAADLFTFVDDLCPTSPGAKECWHAARRAGNILNWLGLQDASRKRQDSSQATGAWAGLVVRVNSDGVFVLSDEEKWIKAKKLMHEVLDLLEEDSEDLPRHRLEQIRGFLVYVTRTYLCMVSYLIGLHMTIDSWRGNRDGDGWRLSTQDLKMRARAVAELDNPDVVVEDPEAPPVVVGVPRLGDDTRAVLLLMESDFPVLRRVRCRKTSKAYYGFGDAGVGLWGNDSN